MHRHSDRYLFIIGRDRAPYGLSYSSSPCRQRPEIPMRGKACSVLWVDLTPTSHVPLPTFGSHRIAGKRPATPRSLFTRIRSMLLLSTCFGVLFHCSAGQFRGSSSAGYKIFAVLLDSSSSHLLFVRFALLLLAQLFLSLYTLSLIDCPTTAHHEVCRCSFRSLHSRWC